MKEKLTRALRNKEASVLIILLAVMIIATIFNPKFLSFVNMMDVLKSNSVLGICALGMLLIILTGGISHNRVITDHIAEKVSFIAPVVVYPGENEMDSLAENGYGVLSGEFRVRQYDPDRILP